MIITQEELNDINYVYILLIKNCIQFNFRKEKSQWSSKNYLLWVISDFDQNLNMILKESSWGCMIFMLKHVKHINILWKKYAIFLA